MEVQRRKTKKDLIGIVLFVLISLITFIWIFVDENKFLRILLSIISISVVAIYYQRVRNLPLEIRSPLGDSFIVLSGINVSAYLLSEIIIENQPTIGNFMSEFTPSVGLGLLFTGVLSKTLLLDAVIKEISNNISNGLKVFYRWITAEKLNLIRIFVLILSSIILISRDEVDRIVGREFAGFISLLLYSLVVLLGSLKSRPDRKNFRFRLFVSIIGLWIVIWPFGFLRDIHEQGSRTLGIALLLWVISIPTILNGTKRVISYCLNLIKALLTSIKRIILTVATRFKEKPVLYLRILLTSLGLIILGYEILLGERNQLVIIAGIILILPLIIPPIFNWIIIFAEFMYQVLGNTFNWVERNKFLSFRIISLVIGIGFFIIAGTTSNKTIGIIGGFTFTIAAILPTILVWFYKFSKWLFHTLSYYLSTIWMFLVGASKRIYEVILVSIAWTTENKTLSLRILSFFIGFGLFLFGRSIELGNSSLGMIGGFLFTFISISPTLFRWLYSLSARIFESISYYSRVLWEYLVKSLNWLNQFFHNRYQWIKNNQLSSARLTSSFLSFLSFFAISEPYNFLVAGLFLFLALLPILVNISKSVGLVLFKTSIVIKVYFQHNLTRLSGWTGIVSFFGSIFYPGNELVKFGLTILSAVLLSFAWDQLMMRFIDFLVYLLLGIISKFLNLLRYLYLKLTPNAFVSLIAWILLIFSIFLGLLVREIQYETLLRLAIFLISIVTWNMAYDYRRARFYKFINWMTLGIVRSIISIVKGILHFLVESFYTILTNILIIFAWIFAIFLFYLSFGLIFATGRMTSSLFGNISDDKLVSIIVGISLTGIGILSIQQSFVRRETLQITEIKNR